VAELTKAEGDKVIALLNLVAGEPHRGVIDSSDGWSPSPLDPYCDDRGADTDTFNLAHDLDYLGTGHDSDTDTSITRITEAGRLALKAGGGNG